MTDVQRMMIETIYDNTVFKYSVVSSLDKSKMSMPMEELSALLDLREPLLSSKDMMILIQFLEQTGFDFNQIYIAHKFQEFGDIVYTLGFVNSNSFVGVHIEYDKTITHVGILIDMPNNKDGN